MLNDEKQKNELISIDRRLRQVADELKKVERGNDFNHFIQLIEEQLLLSFRKNELSRNFSSPITSDAVQCYVAPSDQVEIEPNQHLMLIAGFLFSDKIRELILGDFTEHFHNNFKKTGKAKAYSRLFCDVIKSAFRMWVEEISKQLTFDLSKLNKKRTAQFLLLLTEILAALTAAVFVYNFFTDFVSALGFMVALFVSIIVFLQSAVIIFTRLKQLNLTRK